MNTGPPVIGMPGVHFSKFVPHRSAHLTNFEKLWAGGAVRMIGWMASASGDIVAAGDSIAMSKTTKEFLVVR
jgi:hypothetical protein